MMFSTAGQMFAKSLHMTAVYNSVLMTQKMSEIGPKLFWTPHKVDGKSVVCCAATFANVAFKGRHKYAHTLRPLSSSTLP